MRADRTAQACRRAESIAASDSVAHCATSSIDPIGQAQTVEGVRALCDDNLALARKILGAIEARDPARPAALRWGNTLARLDDALLAIDNASQVPYLMGQAHRAARAARSSRPTRPRGSAPAGSTRPGGSAPAGSTRPGGSACPCSAGRSRRRTGGARGRPLVDA